jgi:DNA-directed RNA polymerase specialized sigma24 family protein
VDAFLAEKFMELEFEKQHFQRLENIVDAEYASMEEAFTADAEEEIIPIEESDEYYTRVGERFLAHDLFIGDDEQTILDDITLKLDSDKIHRLIEMELAKLPLAKRTILDLYLIHQMTVDEIASIRQLSPARVENLIQEVSGDLKKKLQLLVNVV